MYPDESNLYSAARARFKPLLRLEEFGAQNFGGISVSVSYKKWGIEGRDSGMYVLDSL